MLPDTAVAYKPRRRGSMTKADLVGKIAEKTGLTKANAETCPQRLYRGRGGNAGR